MQIFSSEFTIDYQQSDGTRYSLYIPNLEGMTYGELFELFENFLRGSGFPIPYDFEEESLEPDE